MYHPPDASPWLPHALRNSSSLQHPLFGVTFSSVRPRRVLSIVLDEVQPQSTSAAGVVGSIKGWVEAICEAFDCTFRVSRAGVDGESERADGLTAKLVEFGLSAKDGAGEEYGGHDTFPAEGEEEGEEGEGGRDDGTAEEDTPTVDFDATVDDLTPEQQASFACFEAAVSIVFQQWTILKLATEMTWGGTVPIVVCQNQSDREKSTLSQKCCVVRYCEVGGVDSSKTTNITDDMRTLSVSDSVSQIRAPCPRVARTLCPCPHGRTTNGRLDRRNGRRHDQQFL